ncbi:MAG: hypothetical protein EPO68_07525 [Planctomycetota bacterium]|nr:MAG: hypothetical protein EPO68_07525 [Planctomycetota bacterium]
MKRVLKAIAKVAGALLLALLLVEVAMRVAGLRLPPRGPNNFLPLLEDVPDAAAPGLEKALIPNAQGEVVYPGKTSAEDRTLLYRVNPQGFRDREYPQAKPDGALRVAVLGDSVTYGTGVDLKDTLPKQLERELHELCAGRRVEVLNFGVYAYNPRQEVALLEYRALAFDPDIVLLVATVTDASGWGVQEKDAEPVWQARWIRRFGLTSGVWSGGDLEKASWQIRAMNGLRSTSVLADFVANRAYVGLRSGMLEQGYNRDWVDGAPGRPMVHAALKRLKRLAVERGFDVRVLMYPTLTKLGADYPYRFPSEVLGKECGELGLAFVDLLPALLGRDAQSLQAHAHDRHPNAACHGLVAKWLARELRALWCGG